ncbi:MAG: EAL domain-containing protein [Methylocystis sp.]|nr:EAL domain-containing protein [Methylocystis sp.]
MSDLETSMPIAMLTSCLCALITSMSMWMTPFADRARVWTACVFIFSSVVYARRVSAMGGPARRSLPDGVWRTTAKAFLHGALWSALPVFFFREEAGLAQQIAVVSVSIATLFAGAYAASPLPGAMVAHSAPILLGCAFAATRMQNQVYDMIFGVVAMYAIVMLIAAIARAAAAARRSASVIAVEDGALRDELTQLPNRAAFQDELIRAFARHARTGERFALMCFDLDGFKNVNDSLGHDAGDAVLIDAARRLRMSTRESDVVARLGGDEFALIAVDVSGVDAAGAIAERVVAAFREPFHMDGRQLPISVSIGVAMAPVDGLDPESLMRNADSAMYATKKAGRSGYTMFRDRFGFVSERNTLDAELERAFAQKELFMVYQPFVDAKSLKTTGFEALLRWRHPARGVLSAGEIIPLFERTGQIDAVGMWALEEAMQTAALWPQRLRLSVNVSALQLRKPDFEQRVRAALERTGFDPGRLELELTESAMILDGRMACDMLASLRTLGVRTALDDLGTGYSSLANLVVLPLDRLKIDRSFVANLESNPMCASVVKLTFELARTLSLEVTAEGVETERQLEILQAYGCREAQGYLFSRPRAANQLSHLLDSCPIFLPAAPAGEPRVASAVA